METSLFVFNPASKMQEIIALNRVCYENSELTTERSTEWSSTYDCEHHVTLPSARTAFLMRNAFSLIHLRSCEIYPDQLEFQELIGEGQFGLVYKGVWKGRTCAIKKIKSGTTKDSVEYQRLLIELAILCGVGVHPNIVNFFGGCIQDLSSPAIVEELVDGTDLEAYLNLKPIGFNLGRAKVQSWSLDILHAVEHLHGLTPPVMHRDLKPANILVTRDRRTLKLADFGLAKRLPGPCPPPPPRPAPRGPGAREHTCDIGTPRYAAPEVRQHPVRGDAGAHRAAYTEKADVYSAALVLWYLLAGWEPPCDVRRCPRARPDLRGARRRWADLAGLLERMWDHDPAARPAAGECAAAVRAMPAPRGAGCAPACAAQ